MAQPAGATQRRRRDGRPVEDVPAGASTVEAPEETGLGAAGAAGAPVAPVAGLPTVQAIALSSAAILASFERFLEGRDRVVESTVYDLLEEEAPNLPDDARLEVLSEEMQAERAYRAKLRGRLDRDLPVALMIDDPAMRELEVRKILDRERRIVEQREEAIAVRALGGAEARVVEAASPAGAYWKLSPHVREHTRDCLAMAGKVWPWTVLRGYRPPLHTGCACELVEIDRAIAEGLPGADRVVSPELAFHAMQVQEASYDVDELEEEMRVLEARHEAARWGAGTTKGGQFRPRRGGTPGRPTGARLRRRHRGHVPGDPDVLDNLTMDLAQDVPDAKKVSGRDLKGGDVIRTRAGQTLTIEASKGNGQVTIDGEPFYLDPDATFELVHRPAPEHAEIMAAIDRRRQRLLEHGALHAESIQRFATNEAHAGDTPKELRAEWQKLANEAAAVLAGGKGPDFDPDKHHRDKVVTALRDEIAKLNDDRTTLHLPGGIRVVAGPKPVGGGVQGSYVRRAYRIHGGPNGHVDTHSGPGSDRKAAELALQQSANSDREGTLGGRSLRDYREAYLTDAQRATIEREGGLTGWAGMQPVVYRGARKKGVGPEGDVVTLDQTDFANVQQADGLTPDPTKPTSTEGLAGAGGRGGDAGLPELPAPGAGDRYALRYGPNASIEMVELDERGIAGPDATVTRTWPDEWDLADVLKVLAGANAQPRQGKGPDRQARDDLPTHDQIVSGLLERTIGSMPAGEIAELMPGFGYQGKGAKVSYKHVEGDDGRLMLADGFFRQGRDRREGVVFRHLGRRFISELSDEESKGLADAGLEKKAAIVEALKSLNTGDQHSFRVEKPGQAEALAAIARRKGFPLHPDVDAWAGEMAAGGESRVRAETAAVDEMRAALVGMDDVDATNHLTEAGFHTAGYGTKPPTLYMRNFERGSTLQVSFGQNDRVAVVNELEKEPDRQFAGNVARLAGERDPGKALNDLGFVDASSEGEFWMVYTHADGRAVAVEMGIDDRPVDIRVVAAVPDAVERAQRRDFLVNPLAHIQPGDDFTSIRNRLDDPRSSPWRLERPYRDADERLAADKANGSLPAGVTDVVDFVHAGDERQSFRVFLRQGEGQGEYKPLVVERTGRPHTWANRISTDEEWNAHVTEREAAKRAQAEIDARRREEEQRAREEAAGQIDSVIRDKDAASKLANVNVNQAVRGLEAAGWHLESSRRGQVQGRRGVTYTMRHMKDGSMVVLKAQLGWSTTGLSDVKWTPNPQGDKRTRVFDRLPKDKKELYVDALGRADELAGRHNGVSFVTAVYDEGTGKGAAAVHHWSGAIGMGNGKYLKLGQRLDTYLKRRKKGDATLTDKDHFNFYDALSTLQHEVNHGVGKAGDAEGGLAFGSKHYRKSNPHEMAMEEALTEETARIQTLEWLRSWGPDADPVLLAVAREQRRGELGRRTGVMEGSYTDFRAKLKRVFDVAGVEGRDRRELLLRMKFEMTPAERMEFLDDRIREREPGMNTRRLLTSSRGDYRGGGGPVYEEMIDVDIPERPGDNATVGDRVRFVDDDGQEADGVVSSVWNNGDVSINRDGDFGPGSGGAVNFVDVGRITFREGAREGDRPPAIDLPLRHGSVRKAPGDRITVSEIGVAGEARELSGTIVAMKPMTSGAGVKVTIRLDSGEIVERYSKFLTGAS